MKKNVCVNEKARRAIAATVWGNKMREIGLKVDVVMKWWKARRAATTRSPDAAAAFWAEGPPVLGRTSPICSTLPTSSFHIEDIVHLNSKAWFRQGKPSCELRHLGGLSQRNSA